MNNRVLPIYFEEFEHLLIIARELHEDKDEPIPLMSDDNIGKVKSCLAQPFQTFDGKYLYSGFVSKAAILFYLLAKGHALQNGNKRMAILTLTFFYYKNGATLSIPDKQLYRLAKSTAISNDIEEAMRNIRLVLQRHNRNIKRTLF